MVNVEWW